MPSQLISLQNAEYSENTLQSSTCLFDKKVSCPALKKLELNGCHKLKYAFTSSMVKSVVNLETLRVSKCDEMEGVIEGTLTAEEGTSSSIRLFPKLVFMELLLLPNLRSFGCEISPIEFPLLRKLKISSCAGLNTIHFIIGKSETISLDPKLYTNDAPLPQYIFNEKATSPRIELSWKDEILVEKWHGQYSPEYFQADLDFSDKKSLVLLECGSLKNLGSASENFRNITSLEVSKCHGLIKLVKTSTAETLGTLKKLRISNCRMMEEIVEYSGDEPKSIFKFPNLMFLGLKHLPSLTSFCSAKYNFDFPNLAQLIVEECHNLKFFSQGDISIPSSLRIRFAESDIGRSVFDLNATITELYTYDSQAQISMRELGLLQWKVWK